MNEIIPYGDKALLLRAGDDISPETNAVVRKMMCLFDENPVHGVVDITPSYNELLVCYDPLSLPFDDLLETIHAYQSRLHAVTLPEGSLVEIPVIYGGRAGPDLAEVARINDLSVEEVIQIHSHVDYLVYMLGFTPGFCYLGGMDSRIAAPRKENPPIRVNAGSVGIAGQQTGIYPIESPGGWQIIGRTDLMLFDPERDPVFLAHPGDRVRFIAVGEGETGKKR